ncbi:MAG TPA: hypothetical protein VMF90_10675 [Rhizobiaceae bacterium]|nr:hypothetical protein [Rhizobiaceae bacterium]
MPVNWSAVIEGNHGVLKRILAELVAMADAAVFTSPLRGGRREASGGGGDAADTPTRRSDDRRPPLKGEVEAAATLPRHLHTAILRILRPAEAAARRLIVVMARGIVVTLPPFRPRPPAKTSLARKGGTGIILPRGFVIKRGVIMPKLGARAADLPPFTGEGDHAERGVGGIVETPTPRIPSLPLFDPRKRFFYIRPMRNRGVPRISDPGVGARLPIPVRREPMPGGRVSAARIQQRLATLAAALDDLPGQAKRFAQLRALRLAARAREREREVSGAPAPHPRPRALHVWPLRPGHPPGGQRRPKHEIDEVLKDLQYFAREVLEQPDTS